MTLAQELVETLTQLLNVATDRRAVLPTGDLAANMAIQLSRQALERAESEGIRPRSDPEAELANKAALEQQRDSIVGRVVVAHALNQPEFRKQVAALLRREVTNKAELRMIGELLDDA